MKPHQTLRAVFLSIFYNSNIQKLTQVFDDQFYGFASYFSRVHVTFSPDQTEASTIVEKQTDP